MTRSHDLPEFSNPPINELVMGVQFAPPSGYQLIYAYEVFSLFQSRYPKIEERAPLPPKFETFGSVPPIAGLNFEVLDRPGHPRFWFISAEGQHLLQFQQDKFYHNWRQVDGQPEVNYPRYGAIRSAFSQEIQELSDLFVSRSLTALQINQVEITYINRIYGDGPTSHPRPDEWLRFLKFGDRQVEFFNGSYGEVIRSEGGDPEARLYVDLNSAVDLLGRSMLSLSLTARGAPPNNSISSALDFLDRQSDFLVKTFADITTEDSHIKWQRMR